MISRIVAVGLLVSVLGVGCSTDTPMAPSNDTNLTQSDNDAALLEENAVSPEVLAKWGHRPPMQFEVRVENISTDETLPVSTGGFAPILLSPGVWTMTHGVNPLFKPGQFDKGRGLEQLAEDGNPTNLQASIDGKFGVESNGIFNTPDGASGPRPAFPGESFVFMVEAKPGDYLSFVSMFAQSNDLFYGPGLFGIPMFSFWGQPTSGDASRRIALWDAGTEVNQEPGIGPDQAPRQSGPNIGASEHKRIWFVHDGYTYPDRDQVIKITITPMGSV